MGCNQSVNESAEHMGNEPNKPKSTNLSPLDVPEVTIDHFQQPEITHDFMECHSKKMHSKNEDKRNTASARPIKFVHTSEKRENSNKLPSNWSNIILSDSLLREIVRCFPFGHSSMNSGKLESGQRTISVPRDMANQNSSRDFDSADTYKITRTFSHSVSPSNKNKNNNNNNLEKELKNLEKEFKNSKNSTNFDYKNKRTNSAASQKTLKTVNLMVLKSLETVVPIVLPLEIWLRERLSNWIQLSGHEGTIIPASEKTLWKKRAANDNNETDAYYKLMSDQCANFVPKFYKEVEHNGEFFIEIEDLTHRFNNPAIIDVKLGTRTFLESEVTNQKLRNDLFCKMVQLDPNEPTPEENNAQAVTKLRYMQFREKESSTASLGFRIDAIKERNSAYLCTNFKKLKIKEQIASIFRQFFDCQQEKLVESLIGRLKLFRSIVENSDFFKTHEVIGSSLLILYDDKTFGVWMIDFAKAFPLENGIKIDHRSPWHFGNHEDGYLFGLDNLIQVLESIIKG